MDISVIVVSYNTRDLLRECLLSVYGKTVGVEYEVFVVDNRSSDGSADMVEAEFPQVHLIRSDENVGFARGNNAAMVKGSGRYFLLLNPDTQLVNNAIGELMAYMDRHADVGVAGSMLLNDEGEVQNVCRKFSRILHEIGEFTPLLNRFTVDCLSRDYLPQKFDYRSPGETDYVQGACLMVRGEATEEVGLLDERFFMYSEEEDWCYRIKQRGWKVMYVPSAVIVHYRGMSTRQRSREMLMELYRSKIKFFRKNHGRFMGWLLRVTLVALMGLRISFYSLVSILTMGKRGMAGTHRAQSLTILRAMISWF